MGVRPHGEQWIRNPRESLGHARRQRMPAGPRACRRPRSGGCAEHELLPDRIGKLEGGGGMRRILSLVVLLVALTTGSHAFAGSRPGIWDDSSTQGASPQADESK